MFWDEVIRFLDETEHNADCNDRNKVVYYCSRMEGFLHQISNVFK